jgi:hypothetical protein
LPDVAAAPVGPPATISVEVLGAPKSAAATSAPVPEDLVVLLDVTRSMRVPESSGVQRNDLARRAAADFLRALPEDQPVEVSALGTRGENAGCTAPVPLSGASSREALISRVEQAGAGRETSEASLAFAIDGARRRLVARAGTARRLVVFSDLADDCGGEWCEAVTRAASEGISVELVELGPVLSASCLREMRLPDFEHAGSSPEPPAYPVFQVRRATPEGASERVLSNGRAGSQNASVPPGRAVVSIELEPPEWIGPLELRPGSHTRIRVLDFVGSNPPWREVFVQPGGAAQPSGGKAANAGGGS